MVRAHPRLDDWLVSNGHYPSRARARDAILRKCVSLNGEVCTKPARAVLTEMNVSICDDAKRYVSRAALKLLSAINETGYSPTGRIAVDLGASTGGFCQVLLEHGAEHVYAVDVGHDQLDTSLRNTERVTNLEGLNARELGLDHLEQNRPSFLTSDLSFISLKLALPASLQLAAAGAKGLFLVKPQFEVGKENLGKGGVVRDSKLAEDAADDMRIWLDTQKKWRATHLIQSPIKGGDGNVEFVLAGSKDD